MNSVAHAILIEDVSLCPTRVRPDTTPNLWLHWIRSFSHNFIGVNAFVSMLYLVSVSILHSVWTTSSFKQLPTFLELFYKTRLFHWQIYYCLKPDWIEILWLKHSINKLYCLRYLLTCELQKHMILKPNVFFCKIIVIAHGVHVEDKY